MHPTPTDRIELASDEDSSSSEEQQRQEAISSAPSGFVCPLTLEVMRDPVVSRYGQSYEREAIMEWLAAGNETCPMTRQPLRMSGLISNQQLRMKIRRWQLDNGLDISLVGDANNNDFDDDRRVVIYFTLPDMENEDAAERSQDDPQVILEATEQRNRQIQRMMLRRSASGSVVIPAPNSNAPTQPALSARRQQRVHKRPGLLGRLMSSRRNEVTA